MLPNIPVEEEVMITRKMILLYSQMKANANSYTKEKKIHGGSVQWLHGVGPTD